MVIVAITYFKCPENYFVVVTADKMITYLSFTRRQSQTFPVTQYYYIYV